ncbi:MAG: BlaI/MecI/CopY family transcriptional regulator [Clostridia bacterium]|nr:BlaI/MecI/CopY family transcriptional regulator [Clostridia bacterium]
MNDYQMGTVESRFADIIWSGEPISSTELVKIAESELRWKKSTTYTVLKRLCDKGIFKNEGGRVTSVISKEEFFARQSEKFVDEAFEGSLPAFLAAFTTRKALSEKDIAELRRMVDEFNNKKG